MCEPFLSISMKDGQSAVTADLSSFIGIKAVILSPISGLMLDYLFYPEADDRRRPGER